MNFARTEIAINALQALVIKNDNGQWTPAKTLGGTVSWSGLTVSPRLVEKGAIAAYRSDSIPAEVPNPLVVFSGRGTAPEDLRELNRDVYLQALEAWKTFRSNLNDATLPPAMGEEGHLARRATRYMRTISGLRGVTFGEVLGMAEARGGLYRDQFGFQVTEDEEETDATVRWHWESWVPGVGYAHAWAPQGTTPPAQWGSVTDGAMWEYTSPSSDGGNPWQVETTFRVTEDGEVRNEYFMRRMRKRKDETWQVQFKLADDGDELWREI